MSNYIFDVDGTLLDSYGGILESVMEVLNNNGYEMDEEDALKYILKYSVQDLLIKVEKENNIPFSKTIEEYKESRGRTQFKYSFMNNAIKTIKELKELDCHLFIFTHKGKAINDILKLNNLDDLFDEVIHAFGNNFKRKPNRESIDYLVDKYNLKREDTYYVGDRPLDIECAYNSGIKSIFYNDNNMILKEEPTYRIKDLYEIIEIEKKKAFH